MSKKLRIVYIADFLLPSYVGGSARYASDLLEGLRQVSSGSQFCVITRPPRGLFSLAQQTKTENIYLYIPSIRRSLPFIVLYLKLVIEIIRSDIVITHHPILPSLFLLPLLFKKHIHFFHGPLEKEYVASTAKPLDLLIHAKKLIQLSILFSSNKILVASEYMLQYIPSSLTGKADVFGPVINRLLFSAKLTSNNSFIETESISFPATTFSDQLNTYNNWSSRNIRPRFIVVRRLTPRTGVYELCEQFLQCNLNFEMFIVGVGPLESELHKLVSTDSRFCMTGFLKDDDYIRLLRAIDCMILPSRTLEGFGLVTLESLVNSVPVVVSSSAGGGARFMEQIDPKYVYQLDDFTSLIESINFAIEENLPHDKLDRLIKNFDAPSAAKRFLSLL